MPDRSATVTPIQSDILLGSALLGFVWTSSALALLFWYRYRPAGRSSAAPIQTDPAPADVLPRRPADAGAWRMEAILEADRDQLRPIGEGRVRGLDRQ